MRRGSDTLDVLAAGRRRGSVNATMSEATCTACARQEKGRERGKPAATCRRRPRTRWDTRARRPAHAHTTASRVVDDVGRIGRTRAMRMRGRCAWSLALCMLAACGGGTSSDAGADSGSDAGGGVDMAADMGTSPCTTDEDADGHRAPSCGGDDCDDADPNRYPGNHEVCDTPNHDEDCDPRTFGIRDDDADGYPDQLCCNADPAGGMRCGSDCDDTLPPVHPTANETCNGMDDDCNGLTDDVASAVFLDCDGDGFGDTAHTMT